MKKIFLSFLLVMVGISHTLAQGLDANVEQRLKDFFTQYETSYANIGKCKLGRYEVNHNQKKLDVYASSSFGYQPFTPENTEAIYRLLKQSLTRPCKLLRYNHLCRWKIHRRPGSQLSEKETGQKPLMATDRL